MDDFDYHARLIDMFEESEDAFSTTRDKAARDIDYYDHKQWTEEEVKELKRRGQPAITWNRIQEKIDYLQGDEKNRRTKPQALPNTPQHEQDAFAATDAMQFICKQNSYDELRSRVWADLLKAGWGGLEVVVEQRAPDLMGTTAMTGGEYKVVVRRCQWDRMFWDPHSCEEDFSDAGYLGMVLWMDREDAIRQYGLAAADVFDETINIGSVGGTFDDRPKYQTWASTGKRRRIRVVLMYFKNSDGEWDFCEFTKGGILKDGPSPWTDEDGKTEHPFAWRSAYVDRDNNRYGAIRGMIDLQDEINKRRSKALHHFTARQTYGNQKYNANSAANKKQLAKPDGHVTLNGEAQYGKDFGVLPTDDQAAGHFELLQQATGAFDMLGPVAALQGRENGSGRAILAKQQGGQVQLGTLTDSLKQLDYDAYRKIWNRVRQFWTAETWIRVTDDERNIKFVGLNEPQYDEFGQVVGMKNEVAKMDVDITIEDAPAAGTMVDEQFQTLVALKQMDRNNEIPFKSLIRAAPNLREKQRMIEDIEKREQQPPDPMAVAGAQAEVAQTQAGAAEKQANARLKGAQATQEEIETQIGMAALQGGAVPKAFEPQQEPIAQ